MQSQKMRAGILLDSFEVPAWAAKAIERVQQGGAADFVLVILANTNGADRTPSSTPWLYEAFDRLDRWLFGRQPDPLTPSDIKGSFSRVPQIHVTPIALDSHYGLSEHEIVQIRQYGLDIVIRIGLDGLSFDSLPLSKYGTWYYYHGDDTQMSGGPAGFWEVVEDRPETGTALLATGGEIYGKRVLYRSSFFTYPLSPARHRSYYFWAAASFLPRQIEYLQRYGEEKFLRQTERFNRPTAVARKTYGVPEGPAAVAAIGRITARLLRELFKRVFTLDQWSLRWKVQKNMGVGFKEFNALTPPKDRYWADPHVIRREGKYYIFIEEYLRSKNKGHISVIESDDAGEWKVPVKVLEQACHLSYPFVFEWDGIFYMVPESAGNRRIDLYESTGFPYNWQFKETLMDHVRAVDTTLLYHANKWWLFTAIAENEAAAPNVELFLFSSDQLLHGNWMPHPQNPVVSDVKRARPAGAIFHQGGKLFRPSQDCSRGYGYSIALNEIEVLSESEYCEHSSTSIKPEWDRRVLATHTFARCSELTVIDAFSRVWRMG